MSVFTKDDDVREHLMEVGLVCAQWAYLELLFEITFWWFIGLLNREKEGRVITGGLNLETTAKRVCELSHLKIKAEQDRNLLESIKDRILKIVDERNLAVHGRRKLMPDGTLTGLVTRGNYKRVDQSLPLIRLRNLNVEIAAIIDELEPLLCRLGIIEGAYKI
jgi:hypothetical protein